MIKLSLLIGSINAQQCPTITSTLTTGCQTKSGCPNRICDAFTVVTNPCNCPSTVSRTTVSVGCSTNSAGCYTRGCYTSYQQTNLCSDKPTETTLSTTLSSTTSTTASPTSPQSISCPKSTYWVKPPVTPSSSPCPTPGVACTTRPITTPTRGPICDLLITVSVPCGCPSIPASTTLPCTTRCETLSCGTFWWNDRALDCGSTTSEFYPISYLNLLDNICNLL